MPVKKKPDQPSGEAAAPAPSRPERKAWKRKTPVEVFLGQEDKLRREVEQAEQELKQKREQLRRFEEARKIFENS